MNTNKAFYTKEELNFMAKVVAHFVSGVDVESVVPEQFDVDVAKKCLDLIETEVRNQ